MANWTDKDKFRLIRNTRDCYFHAICPGVVNSCNRYSKCGDVLAIRTNGEIMTAWLPNASIDAEPINRVALAELIRQTKPKEDLPVFVVSIPDTERPDIGMVTYCWMHLNTAKTMQMYQFDGVTKTVTTYTAPPSNNDPVGGFVENSMIRVVGTPRIYYDWREALTPITNYFKTVIKFCKDTGKIRRLEVEAASQALNDHNKTICALISKNNKRFKTIEF